MLHFSNQYPPKTVVVRNIKGSTQTIILYLRDAKRVKTSQPQLMWQFLRATSICFRKLWYRYNASGFTHGVTPIGFANFRDWVEGFCHKKCAVWHVNKSAKPEIQRYARIALHSVSHGVATLRLANPTRRSCVKARTMGLPMFWAVKNFTSHRV